MTTKKEKKTKTEGKKYNKLFWISFSLLIIALALFAVHANRLAVDTPALVINGEEVSLEEIRLLYVSYPQPAAREIVLDNVIQDTIDYKLLLQEAKRQGIIIPREDIDAAYQNFLQQQGLTEQEFLSTLNGSGTSRDDYRLRIEEDLLVNQIISQIDDGVRAEEVDAYYQDNLADYLLPEEVVVRQITLTPDLSDEQLTQTANTIFTELQTSDFCDVAQRYSLDKTCNSYGIGPGDAFPAFVTAAYNQEIGGVTLVQGPDGYYFVQTINKLNFNPVPFNEVRETIESQLGAEQFQNAYNEYLGSLREDATIVNNLQ